MNTNIEQAIEAFRNQSGRYRRTNRYYRGEHNLNFATQKFVNTFGELFREFALNLCPAIVDATRDKLKITGFGIESVGSPTVREGSSRPSGRLVEREQLTTLVDGHSPDEQHRALTYVRATDTIDHIWRANRMAVRAGEVHKEALKNGDAYVIVWPGEQGGVHIFPNSAESVTVHYDEELPGRIAWAAKYWRDADKRTRLNLFFPDRIEKYISTRETDTALPAAKEFIAVQSNPFGVVPVFHFANNADIGSLGASELEAAIPVQDGLNKSVLDMLVAMEVCAFRQRWVAGIEIKTDAKTGKAVSPFVAGVDTIWQTENPNARFGDFASADLEQFLKVKDGFRIDMASVTGTPLYYLMPQVRALPSGESMRRAETRFLAKVRDRQEAFGAVWADVMAFALQAAGHAGVSLITNWEDPSPESERETLENLRIKKDLGISTEQVLREAGYGDVEIKRMTRN